MIKRFAIFAPLPAVRKRTRLAKILPVLQGRGFDISFFGWEREVGEARRWASDGVKEAIILRGGGYGTVLVHLMYPVWMILTFFHVLRFGRGATLLCLGWETAFPAVLASSFTGARVIFDDADRFSLIVKLPFGLQGLIEAMERWTSRRVSVHVIPSFSRYNWRGSNMHVLKNSPSTVDYGLASVRPSSGRTSNLVVYANGWVGETRGAPIFLKALRELDASGVDVRFIIAGRVDGEAGGALIKHPSVDYRGEMSQAEALAIYKDVDVVLTYYDPKIEINRFAESNKWGDCVYFGKPFVVNSEVLTAKEFILSGAAWGVPYYDYLALAKLLDYLSNNRKIIDNYCQSISKLKSEYQPFDLEFSLILDKLDV